jgi:hypothetical protein
MQSKQLVLNYKWKCDVVDLFARTAWTIDNVMARVHPAVVNAMSSAFFRQVNTLLCKKRFVIFPSPAEMSLTKLSLAGINFIIPAQRNPAYLVRPSFLHVPGRLPRPIPIIGFARPRPPLLGGVIAVKRKICVILG